MKKKSVNSKKSPYVFSRGRSTTRMRIKFQSLSLNSFMTEVRII